MCSDEAGCVPLTYTRTGSRFARARPTSVRQPISANPFRDEGARAGWATPSPTYLRAPVKTGEVQRMEESYGEGVATHTGPESCAVVREGRGEALTGGRAGRVSSRESLDHSGVPTPWR